MGVFDKLSMTDEEKEQARQLNEIGYINALNTHNQELQQKVQMFDAEITRLRERLAEADEANRRVSDENARLRQALYGEMDE